MSLPIEDYALIGDTHSAALVGRNGSIDWMCLPRFDSAASFSAILGDERNGHWQIVPTGQIVDVKRSYRGLTLIVDTEFETAGGRVRLTDFMPPRDRRVDVMRRVEGLDGEVELRMQWVIRFDYGGTVPWVRRFEDGISATAGPDSVYLRGDPLPHPVDHRHEATFTVRAGEIRDFSMTWYPSHHPVPSARDTSEQLARTERFWSEWARRCTYDGPHADAVTRSLLTLKALTYAPTGGIVAAPTTSLPEQLGGQRNWDYRYCWLRDAALTLQSLIDAGYREEAKAWRGWLLRAVAGDPDDLQILYGVAGERRLAEWTVDWLPGYERSAPVRVGNAAYTQFQTDVYGEVMESLRAARRAGVHEDDFSWPLQTALISNLSRRWVEPDNGIWEVRGPKREFTHSRAMAWLAFDCAVDAAERDQLPGPVETWRATRDKIKSDILSRGFDPTLGSFTQYYGGQTLDASLLLLGSIGLITPDDPRFVSTVAAVERELRDGPFVMRYSTAPVHSGDTVDGLPPGEGAFLACSFWLVRALAEIGRRNDAEALFTELLALSNDVGLLAEEYDPDGGRMVGNFPQAFSHLALVSAAQALWPTVAA